MKLTWTAVSVLAFVIGGLFAWGVRLEIRVDRALDVDGRLTNIEEMLRPVLVEHEIRRRLAEAGLDVPPHDHGPHDHFPEVLAPAPPPPESQIRDEAEQDVDERIKQHRMKK